MNPFIHLRAHGEYSLLQSAAKMSKLVETAALQKSPALSLTDINVMYGVVSFYELCKSHHIKPIIGCAIDPDYVFLAKNQAGYQNLVQLSTQIQMGQTPSFEQFHQGLICLSGHVKGELGQKILMGKEKEAEERLHQLRDIFKDDFYLELMDHGQVNQRHLNTIFLKWSQSFGIPYVVTNEIRYVEKQDAITYQLLQCIKDAKILEESHLAGQEMYLKTYEQMKQTFPYAAAGLDETLRVAEKCHFEFEFGATKLPKYPFHPCPIEFLKEKCFEGLKQRYMDIKGEPTERLDYELGIIEKMGYADYFLIISDVIHHARKNGITVGPGRGSSAGSIVAYVLFITQIDPLRYDLLFERFLNPERISLPDIDIGATRCQSKILAS